MKSRRVMVSLEIETCIPLAVLRRASWYRWARVLQAQANVIRARPKKKA